jgi:hypothetical protein
MATRPEHHALRRRRGPCLCTLHLALASSSARACRCPLFLRRVRRFLRSLVGHRARCALAHKQLPSHPAARTTAAAKRLGELQPAAAPLHGGVAAAAVGAAWGCLPSLSFPASHDTCTLVPTPGLPGEHHLIMRMRQQRLRVVAARSNKHAKEVGWPTRPPTHPPGGSGKAPLLAPCRPPLDHPKQPAMPFLSRWNARVGPTTHLPFVA